MTASQASDDAAIPSGEVDALATLVASRICHDLVNPIGAISNGVELIGMDGAVAASPELALVAEAVSAVAARLRFCRVAFGAALPDQTIPCGEVLQILADSYRQSRYRIDWSITGDLPRPEVRLAFLCLLCFESILPRGGTIQIERARGYWRVIGEGERLAAEPELWALLSGGPLPTSLRPAQVQFALAPRVAGGLGRMIGAKLHDRIAEVGF